MDPYLDAQVIYSQYHQGRDTLASKYDPKKRQQGKENNAGTKDNDSESLVPSGGGENASVSSGGDGEGETGAIEGANVAVTGGGGTDSITDQSVIDEDQKRMEAAYQSLVEVLDELAYHHSQVPVL